MITIAPARSAPPPPPISARYVANVLPIRDVEPILRPIFASEAPASRRLDALLGLAKLLARDLEQLGLPGDLAERLALKMLLPWVKA